MNAGIADQDIDTAIGGNRIGYTLIDLLFLCNIHRNRHRSVAFLADFIRSGRSGIQRQIRDYHLCAFARVFEGDFLADAAGSAGNDGDFVLE